MSAARTRVRLALVGCGAVGERYHLPAIARSEDVERAALVDTDVERAATLARLVPAGIVTADLDEAAAAVDAAIVAVPNRLHAEVAGELRRGVHVLVEKPMASTAAECDGMIAAADAARDDPISPLRPFTVRYAASKTRVRIDKARRLLGYEPAFDLEHGMQLTEAWARWAGLLDPEPSL